MTVAVRAIDLLALAPRTMPQASPGLVGWARRHNMVGLVHAAIRAGDLAVDAQTAAAVRQALREQGERTAVLEHTIRTVVPALTGAGVEVRLLKGAASAHLDHPHPWWRGYVDVDLLVRAPQMALANEVLQERGTTRGAPALSDTYEARFSKSAQQRTPAGVEIDLHRMLTHEPFGFLIDHDRLFEVPPDEVRLGGMRIPTLSAPHRFIHACLHAVLGGHPMAGVPLADAWSLAHRMHPAEVDEVQARAREWRAAGVVATALGEAVTRLSAPPSSWPPLVQWADGHRSGAWEQAALRTFLTPRRQQLWRTLVTLPVAGSARWPYLREQVWPSQDFLAQRGLNRSGWVRASLVSALRRGR